MLCSGIACENDICHVPADPTGSVGHIGKTVRLQLTLRAATVIRRGRKHARAQLNTDLLDNPTDLNSQCTVHRDLNLSPRPAIPNIARRYRHPEHLLQAKGLRAQLQIRRVPMCDAGLVFDWNDSVGLDLHRIGAAGQPQPFRPQGNCPQNPSAAFLAVRPAVDAPMRAYAFDSVRTVVPDAVAMNESTLPRAVCVVFNGGNEYYGFSVKGLQMQIPVSGRQTRLLARMKQAATRRECPIAASFFSTSSSDTT